MKLVYEDEHGAYLGVRAEFSEKFLPREANPNFEVYDSLDNNNRFIAVKSSRLPDDEDTANCLYGIDFNRPKPDFEKALHYGTTLPEGYEWLNGVAFAAKTEQEYIRKSSIWDVFYSYIWGTTPQAIWVAPHSGGVNREPDNVLRFPKLMIDSFTAGVAALCALKNTSKPLIRMMIAIHGTGHLGAVLNLGDFGVLSENKMREGTRKIESKYSKRAQILSEGFKKDFSEKTLKILEDIFNKRGTLNPKELVNSSYDDSVTVNYYLKGLKLYGQEVKEPTFIEFKQALQKLSGTSVPIISNNYLYTGRDVGRLLGLSEKISQGQLGSALVIECARFYAAHDPEFVSEVILNVKDGLFSH